MECKWLKQLLCSHDKPLRTHGIDMKNKAKCSICAKEFDLQSYEKFREEVLNYDFSVGQDENGE